MTPDGWRPRNCWRSWNTQAHALATWNKNGNGVQAGEWGTEPKKKKGLRPTFSGHLFTSVSGRVGEKGGGGGKRAQRWISSWRIRQDAGFGACRVARASTNPVLPFRQFRSVICCWQDVLPARHSGGAGKKLVKQLERRKKNSATEMQASKKKKWNTTAA